MASISKTMDRLGLGSWKRAGDRVAMSKDEFLELVTELAGAAIEDSAKAQALEARDRHRWEGAAWALRALSDAGALGDAEARVVAEWLLLPDNGISIGQTLTLYGYRIVPPRPPTE